MSVTNFGKSDDDGGDDNECIDSEVRQPETKRSGEQTHSSFRRTPVECLRKETARIPSKDFFMHERFINEKIVRQFHIERDFAEMWWGVRSKSLLLTQKFSS